MTKSWCSLIWNHHFIGPGGNCKPCCRFKGQCVPKTNNLKNDSLDNLFNNKFMSEIRQKMIRGEMVDGCAKCYEEENTGKRLSLRQNYNRQKALTHDINISHPKIRFLEVAFSNACDLMCVMCSSYFSTAWNKENLENLSSLNYKDYGYMTIDVDTIKSVIPNLRHLKFTGGEPLLIKEYQILLEELASKGNIESTFLNYSLNLMYFPKDRLLDLWKRVKYVEVAASFDGVGEVIEYTRYPSKWEVVEENMIKYMKLSNKIDVRIGMRSSMMIYNILDLPNMVNWWVEHINKHTNTKFGENSWFNPTHVAQPQFLNLQVLPEKAKEFVTERLWDKGINNKVTQNFNHMCNYMNSEDRSELLDKFKLFTKAIESTRKVSFENICPEIYNEIF